MITKREEEIERKVPLLGDIPILGQAFRYDFKHTLKTELLIFLTPRVVHNEAEAEMIKEIEIQRINSWKPRPRCCTVRCLECQRSRGLVPANGARHAAAVDSSADDNSSGASAHVAEPSGDLS